MAAAAAGERTAVVQDGGGSYTYAELAALSRAGAHLLRSRQATALVYIGTNHPGFPLAVFAAAAAGVPFVPLNYRLSESQLAELVGRHPGALVVHDKTIEAPVDAASAMVREDFLSAVAAADAVPDPDFVDPESVAVILYPSGTTAAPKGVLLRHRHLMAYV